MDYEVKDFTGSNESSDKNIRVGTVKFPDQAMGLPDTEGAARFGSYIGKTLTDDVKDELTKWTNLLDVLQKGPSKPNSPLFELEKIESKIRRNKQNDWDTDKLEELRDNIVKCCPADSTVNDSISHKGLRESIVRRIEHITGIREY